MLFTHIFGDNLDVLVGDADVLGDIGQIGREHSQVPCIAQNLRMIDIHDIFIMIALMTCISDKQRHSGGQRPSVSTP